MAGESIKISPEKLADLRVNQLFFTQDELGQELKISGGRVGTLEQVGGAMSLKTFRKLAELAKKTPEQLKQMIGEGAAENDMPEWAKRFKTYEEAARELRRFFPDPHRQRPAEVDATPYERET